MAGRSASVESTRRTIEIALIRLLASKPYGSITMGEIASEADVAERTVRRHYGTKDALLAATVALGRTALQEAMDSRPIATSVEEDLRSFVDLMFEMLDRYRAETRAVLSRAAEVPELRDVMAHGVDAIREGCRGLLSRWPGAWSVDSDQAVDVLFAATSHYSLAAYTELAAFSRAEAAKIVGDKLCAYLLRRQS